MARSDFALTRVEARAFATQSVHASLPRENATQFGASASGAYEPTRDLQLRADVSAARYVELLDGPARPDEPAGQRIRNPAGRG